MFKDSSPSDSKLGSVSLSQISSISLVIGTVDENYRKADVYDYTINIA